MEMLNACVSKYYLLKHPFYQDWMAGKLSRETLQDYACQYYPHVEAFPRYLGAVHSQCENAATRREILTNLADEEGLNEGVPHPELWIQFAEGLGVERSHIVSTPIRPAIKNVKGTFFDLCRSSLHEGLGALYAYESQVPEVAQSKIEGLCAHYGVNDKKTLSFFEVHKTADVYHRAAIAKIIDDLPEKEKEEALLAAEKAAKSLWDFLTDVHERSSQVSLSPTGN